MEIEPEALLALRTVGDVQPSPDGRLVAYTVTEVGQSHAFPGSGRPSHRVDFVRRVVEWVEQYAGPGSPGR